ncbi:MAG: hypothetical protein ACJATI_003328 [Halioglobus sp.]|jgi:hypothetical protein
MDHQNSYEDKMKYKKLIISTLGYTISPPQLLPAPAVHP